MNKERKIMNTISNSIKELSVYSKTYAIGKGVRRYLFYKGIELKHFELLVENIADVKCLRNVKYKDGEFYLETELGYLKIKEGNLNDYFKTQSFSLNRIALSDKGFIFSDTINVSTYKFNINDREATFIENAKSDMSTMHEYCYLRYEGFCISNHSLIVDFVKNTSNKERMYGLKLALELESSNIADSLRNTNIFNLIRTELNESRIYEFFMNCVRDRYNIDEVISKEDRVNNSLIALIYAFTKGEDFSGSKFDDIFRDFGVKIPYNIYNDVKEIFINGKSDEIYDTSSYKFANPNSKFIQHLVNYYEVICCE